MADYINSKELFSTWGASLMAGSLSELLAPPTMKEYVENDYRSQDGHEVLVTEPRVESRDFALNFLLVGSDRADLLAKYKSFVEDLQSGLLELNFALAGQKFYCYYLNSQKFNCYIASNMMSLNVYLREPNPNKRTATA